MNVMFSTLLSFITSFGGFCSLSTSIKVVEPVTTYVFMAVECPISQNYVYRLNEFYKRYPEMNIIGVFQENTTEEELSDFKQRYSVDFPLVFDKDHRWALKYNVEITPEVFLVDRFDKVLYSGAIDNWFISLGRNRIEPSEHYLLEAFLSIKRGSEVKPKKTKAVGCFLELNTSHHHGQ
ncbi:MAG: redoxin domain-containing protein [Flavobacteriaceae bacterium]